MPFSNQDSIPTVLYFAQAVSPKRILDVGVGLGIYGLLLRTTLDIALERLDRSKWQLRLEGLEIFPDYHNPVWDYAYDRVHIGDVRTFDSAPDSFDLVIINDVLEHLEEREAIACLERLLRFAPTVIVTTPIGHIPQGAWGGNVHETHRSVLSPNLFPSLVCTRITGITMCCVCCRDPVLAEKIRWDAGTAPVSRPEWLPYISYRLRRKGRSILRALGKK
jgi:SAM-dependent methyltransferase